MKHWNDDPSHSDVDAHQHRDLLWRLWREKNGLNDFGWGLPDKMSKRLIRLLDDAALVIYNGAARRIRFKGRP